MRRGVPTCTLLYPCIVIKTRGQMLGVLPYHSTLFFEQELGARKLAVRKPQGFWGYRWQTLVAMLAASTLPHLVMSESRRLAFITDTAGFLKRC